MQSILFFTRDFDGAHFMYASVYGLLEKAIHVSIK